MKKPMSIRKKYRKKMINRQKNVKKTLKRAERMERSDFLQWGATTVNGVKQ